MLWIEAVSVSLILIVLVLLPVRMGLHLDTRQFQLQGVPVSSLGGALVLSIFSFVGFESATTLGGEAREPLKTIPRAVLQCALLSGVFFMLCAYSEVLGLRGESSTLSDTTSPLHLLARKAGVSPLGVAIDGGAFISMFACVLACAMAAARVLMRMARSGLLPSAFERTNRRHGTPGAGIILCAALIFAAASSMVLEHVTGYSVYDLCGSVAVFGFLTAYALVALALPFARRALGQHSHLIAGLSILTVAVIVLIAVFDVHSAADAAHARIPYLYLGYIAAGLGWYGLRRAMNVNR
jgi:amino acid transporter